MDEYIRTPHEVTRYFQPNLMYGVIFYSQLLNNPNKTVDYARRKAVESSLAYRLNNQLMYDKKFLPRDLNMGESILHEIP